MQTMIQTFDEYQAFPFQHDQVFVSADQRIKIREHDGVYFYLDDQGNRGPVGNPDDLDGFGRGLKQGQRFTLLDPCQLQQSVSAANEACFKFWHSGEENGFLSNLYLAPINIDGTFWPTSEHYYQAMKHDDPKIIEKVRRQVKPLNSKFVARRYCKKLNRWPDDAHKLLTMRRAIKAKFDQHPDLRVLLMKTAPHMIIEDSSKDAYWGIGADGQGLNVMGKLLVELRNSYLSQ